MEKQIREIINRNGGDFFDKYFKEHLDDWSTLCVAMDTIGDTTLSIDDYIKEGIGSKEGEKYLRLYGVLQAVFLQQDAIEHLHSVVDKSFNSDKKLKSWEKFPRDNWKELRKLRNLSVGHPVENTSFERGRKKRAMIVRISIDSKTFKLHVYDSEVSDDFHIINIALYDLIESYISEAKNVLNEIEELLVNVSFE